MQVNTTNKMNSAHSSATRSIRIARTPTPSRNGRSAGAAYTEIAGKTVRNGARSRAPTEPHEARCVPAEEGASW
jgi:hypothetical protein